MHAIIRTYSGNGAKELIDVIEKKKAEVERLIRSVKGFVSYSVIRTAGGGFSVSIYLDKAGTEESSRIAREWIENNARNTGVAAPSISEGEVIVHLK
jgi:hypothetical protein